MRPSDVLLTAFTQIRANKLRSFFTLLGIIVSVAFLVAVIAIIQGMNAYVKENIANAMIGSNTFQEMFWSSPGSVDGERLGIQAAGLVSSS